MSSIYEIKCICEHKTHCPCYRVIELENEYTNAWYSAKSMDACEMIPSEQLKVNRQWFAQVEKDFNNERAIQLRVQYFRERVLPDIYFHPIVYKQMEREAKESFVRNIGK